MSAPRGVELQEDILVVLNDELLVAVGHNGGHRALLGLGNRLGLDARLDLAVKNILDKSADILGVEVLGLVIGILGVLRGVLDSEARELLGLQVQVGGMGTEHLGVEGSNVDLTAVLLSDGLEVLGVLLTLLRGLGEDIGEGNASLLR